jgi:lactocepin
MVKRLFAVFAAFIIVLNAGGFYALDITAPKYKPVSVTPPQTVTLIVETKDISAVKKAVLSLDSGAVIMGDYDMLLSGFAVTLSAKASKAVASIDGVTGVWQSLSRMTGSGEESGTADAGLAAALNPGYKYRGEGMVAAIIDTSFDVYHEMFTLSDPKSGRITENDITSAIDGDLTVTNYFSHGGGEGESPYVNAKIPYAFDYSSFDTGVGDNDSHGTHVAGIVAANNCGGHELGFDGIAPEAQLLLMKAGQDNSESLDDYAILYAIEDAITLGADVINMSFSSPAGSSQQEYGSFDYAKVMKSAEEHGVVLICSAGNENMLGKSSNYDNTYGISFPLASNPDYGLVGNPSTFPTSLSVASIDSSYNITNTYIESASGARFVYREPDIAADFTVFGEKLIGYVTVPGAGTEQDYEGMDMDGKAALIMRGTIPFTEKIKNAAAAGAVAAVIYNNDPDENELVTMDLDESVCTIPAVFIYYSDGKTLGADSQMKFKFISGKKTAFRSPSGGMISSFSSRGLTSDLSLKPEITAPGGNIYSSVPSGYGVLSGTSMSAPYMTGAALLVRQMLAGTGGDPYDTLLVRRILMSTAVPVQDAGTGVEYSPRTQGAGLVDIKAALGCAATLYGETSLAKAELGDMLGRVFSFDFSAENRTGSDIVYNVTASLTGDEYKYVILDPADRTYGGKYFITGRTVAFRRAVIKIDGGSGADINKYKSTKSDTVTVPAHSSIKIKINVEIDSGTYTRYKNIFKNGFFAEGFVQLTPADGGQTLSLPYVGYCGDWSDPPVIDGKVNSDEDCFYTQYAFSYALVDGDNYMYNLGCSLFLEADKVNSSAIAISPDGDGSGDYIALALTPLRNIADMSVKIISEDGEVVHDESELGHAVKSYYDAGTGDVNNLMLHYLWDGTDIKNVFYSMPDGKYKLTVYTETESGHNSGEWSMSFTVDTVDPAFDEVYLTHGENGELYLNVTISDNGYLQYAVPYTAEGNLDESYKPAAKDAVSETSLSFDITDAADNGYIYFDIADYALNIKTLQLMLGELEVRN